MCGKSCRKTLRKKCWRLSSLLKATLSTSRSHEQAEGDKDCRRCYPSRPKPTTRVLDRRGVFRGTCQCRLSSAAAVQHCSTKGLALCSRCHLAWASEGTPVCPGKDTHSTLGPELQEGRGEPVWIRHQIHGKRGSGAGC